MTPERVELKYYVGRDGNREQPGDYVFFAAPWNPVWLTTKQMWDYDADCDPWYGGDFPMPAAYFERVMPDRFHLAPGQLIEVSWRLKGAVDDFNLFARAA